MNDFPDTLVAKLAQLAIADFEGLCARARTAKHDLHSHAVAEVLGIHAEDVLTEERVVAKSVFFGFTYGVSFDHTTTRRMRV